MSAKQLLIEYGPTCCFSSIFEAKEVADLKTTGFKFSPEAAKP
jgi:hypothetical protein